MELKQKGEAVNGFNGNRDSGWWRGGRDPSEGASFSLPAPTVGLLAFLAAATLLFSLLFTAYFHEISGATGMVMPGWRSLPIPPILWLNTLLLLLGSAALQGAWIAARRGQESQLRLGLLMAGVLTSLFVLGQFEAWRQLAAAGVFLATNPASSFFYLITAIHGLHVLGGLIAGGRTTVKAWKGIYTSENHLGVQLCAIYWHFLSLIWLIMFAFIWLT
jgi:cytochrome c oxidase subunit 3